MNYADYLEASRAFAEEFGRLTDDEKLAFEPHKWMYMLADVTCETPGCPHGTQRVSFMELCNGTYSSWCGNCNTQNFMIVGIFDDCEVVLTPTDHTDPADPWVMNKEHDSKVAASVD